jgi:hypothetical protein
VVKMIKEALVLIPASMRLAERPSRQTAEGDLEVSKFNCNSEEVPEWTTMEVFA